MRRYCCGFMLLVFGITGWAADSDQALEDLRAANQARQTMASEAADWATEQQRLELLISEAKRQAESQRRFMENNKAAIKRYRQQIAGFDVQTDQAAAVDAVLLDLSAQINDALAERAARLPSGGIERAAQEQTGEAAMVFMRSAARLKQALANGKIWRTSLSSGELDGKSIAYDQLSLGHVCAWWLSRDQKQGGIVERRDGQNILHALDDPAALEAITTALAVAHGDRSPEAVLLPVDQRQLQAGSKQSSTARGVQSPQAAEDE